MKLVHAVRKENEVFVECGASVVPVENPVTMVSLVIEVKAVRPVLQVFPVKWAVREILVMLAILVQLAPKVIVVCVVFQEVQVGKVQMAQKDLKAFMALPANLVPLVNQATQANRVILESMVSMEKELSATKALRVKTVDQEDLAIQDRLASLECVVNPEKMVLQVIQYKANPVHLDSMVMEAIPVTLDNQVSQVDPVDLCATISHVLLV